MSAPLLPTQIPGCQVWLDANDGSTYTLTGGLVSSWADKSGNGNNFSQGTAGRYPSINGTGINNLSTLYFTGPATSPNTTSKFLSNASIQPNVSGYSIFTVAKRDVTAPSGTNYNYLIDGNVSSDFYLFYGGGPSGNYTTFAGTGGGWNDLTENSPSYSVTNSFIGSMVISGSVLSPYFNGSNQTTKVGTTTSYTGLSIGEPQPNNYSGQNWNGLLGEVIIYTSALNSTQRQQVEGYLAWKWGLQGSLPAGHLYKNSQPTLPIVNTTSELILLNSLAQSGTVYLPSTLIAGRIVTFKDTRGSFPLSTMTVVPFVTGQTFENNTTSQTFTEAFGAYSFIAGYDNKWYTIGGSRMFDASISSITTISLNSQNISTGNITTSTLQFRDIATTSTNTLFSLSTNVYMSSPTNFFILGPTKAPKPLFVPVRRGFVPTQIAGSILWLDAADPSVFTGGSVWLDKSGTRNNGIHTGILGNSMPTRTLWTNGLAAARFARAAATTGNSMMTLNAANPALNYTLFIVTNLRSINPIGDPQGQLSWIFINNVDGGRQIKQVATTFPATIQLNFTNAAQVNLVTTLTQNQGFFLTYVVPSAGGANGSGYFNGGTPITGTTLASSATRWYFGSANASANGYWNGDVGEILAYNTALSDTNRQLVEGYLAWKWGLVGSLPSTHPYKNSPP